MFFGIRLFTGTQTHLCQHAPPLVCAFGMYQFGNLVHFRLIVELLENISRIRATLVNNGTLHRSICMEAKSPWIIINLREGVCCKPCQVPLRPHLELKPFLFIDPLTSCTKMFRSGFLASV